MIPIRIGIYLKTLGMCAFLTFAVIGSLTFIMAYVSPEKAVIVTIDTYHEALPELVLMILTWPLMVWAFIDYIKKTGWALSILK